MWFFICMKCTVLKTRFPNVGESYSIVLQFLVMNRSLRILTPLAPQRSHFSTYYIYLLFLPPFLFDIHTKESMENYMYPLNPLQQRDELLVQISSTPLQEQDIAHENSPLSKGRDLANKSRGTKSLLDASGCEKKIVHRDFERQRRQEMSQLYSSLRSLLPIEYVKGKRSISDHMNEATNYIKHLEKKIQELRGKRDKLKRLSNFSATNTPGESLFGPDFATVTQCWKGVEVVVGSSLKNGEFSLSKVLEVLAEEGLSVVSCVTAKVNGRLMHTIQSEVSNQACIDPSSLQQKLVSLSQSASYAPLA